MSQPSTCLLNFLKKKMEIKSYKKKNGDTAYMIRVYMGKVNGTSRYVTRRGFPTKAKARAAILNLQEELKTMDGITNFNYLHFMEKYNLKTMTNKNMVKEEFYNLINII